MKVLLNVTEMQQAKFFMLHTYFRKRIIKGEGCVFMDKKRQEDYHFVKEHIKKEPRDKKLSLIHI